MPVSLAAARIDAAASPVAVTEQEMGHTARWNGEPVRHESVQERGGNRSGGRSASEGERADQSRFHEA
jgi:hypothetical protein